MSLADLLDRLRYEGEGDALDFKAAQYPFVNADDDEKSELLKDILAFANSWRRADAYVLIGVREVKGGRAEILGITDDVDDAQLQQFVNSKTQRPIQFSYATLSVDEKTIAVLHIPLQDRPSYLQRRYGKLEPDTVYVRRGSSTAIASPDEIARMGRAAEPDDRIALEVFFADPDARKRVAPAIRSNVLETPPPKDIPDYSIESESPFHHLAGRHARPEYYRELTRYTRVNRLVSPVWFAIENSGTATAQDVRLEVTVPGATKGVRVLDDDQYPAFPHAEYDLAFLALPRPAPRSPAQLLVVQVEDKWVVTGRIAKVQPKSTVWVADPIHVGSAVSMQVDCAVKVFADNLRVPYEATLTIPIESTTERVDLTRIIELENDRLVNSREHQEFMRRYVLGEDEW